MRVAERLPCGTPSDPLHPTYFTQTVVLTAPQIFASTFAGLRTPAHGRMSLATAELLVWFCIHTQAKPTWRSLNQRQTFIHGRSNRFRLARIVAKVSVLRHFDTVVCIKFSCCPRCVCNMHGISTAPKKWQKYKYQYVWTLWVTRFAVNNSSRFIRSWAANKNSRICHSNQHCIAQANFTVLLLLTVCSACRARQQPSHQPNVRLTDGLEISYLDKRSQRERKRVGSEAWFQGRGWLHVDPGTPGQCECGSTLATSVDVGRIQRCNGRVNDQWAVYYIWSSPLFSPFLSWWHFFLLWFIEPYWASWCKADFRMGLDVWYKGESDGWRRNLTEKLICCCTLWPTFFIQRFKTFFYSCHVLTFFSVFKIFPGTFFYIYALS